MKSPVLRQQVHFTLENVLVYSSEMPGYRKRLPVQPRQWCSSPNPGVVEIVTLAKDVNGNPKTDFYAFHYRANVRWLS